MQSRHTPHERGSASTGQTRSVIPEELPGKVARIRRIDAEGGQARARNLRRVLSALTATALLPVLALGMIVWHEIGHTLVAWALGDRTATFVVYQRTATGSCFGCNFYHSELLSPAANAAVNLGGVAATALAGLLATLVMGWHRRPRLLPRWLLLEVVLLTWAGDLLFQILQAATAPIPAREPVGWGVGYVDLAAAVSFASQASGWPHVVFVIAGAAIAVSWSVVLGWLTWRSWLRSRSQRRTSAT